LTLFFSNAKPKMEKFQNENIFFATKKNPPLAEGGGLSQV
jgi:hypothetical protein